MSTKRSDGSAKSASELARVSALCKQLRAVSSVSTAGIGLTVTTTSGERVPDKHEFRDQDEVDYRLVQELSSVINDLFFIQEYETVLKSAHVDALSDEIGTLIPDLGAAEVRALLMAWERRERFAEGTIDTAINRGYAATALERLLELETPSGFPPAVEEEIGWYVYALTDPAPERGQAKVFYIGKGKGNRVFAHARAALNSDSETENEADRKLDRIRSIRAKGNQVGTFIVRHKLATEQQAFEIEAALIDAFALSRKLGDASTFERLTNKAGGHYSKSVGLMSAANVVAEYLAPTAPEITAPVILVRISKSWTPTTEADAPREGENGEAEDGSNEKLLYDMTRQWWKMGDRRKDARFAFAVSRGIVRQVYSIDKESWEPGIFMPRKKIWRSPKKSEKAERWSFNGQVAPEMAHYVGTDVSHYFRPGNANPISYLNC